WVTSPTSADVYFAAPSSDGLSPIDHYTVPSSLVGGTGTLSGADGGRVRITGLTTGTTYTFTVTATNGVGTSAPSWPTNAVTPVLPPANDDIENAVALAAGTVSATGDNTNATLQQGEYNGFRFSGPHTVWFTWTAPESSTGTATIDTCGSDFDTNLAVFAAGTFTTPLAENGDSCNFTSLVTLPVTPGTSYSIQVSGAGEEQFGAFVLNYSVAGATVPGAPASGLATGGAGSVDLAWTAPRSNGGDTVTDYRIDVSDVSAVGPFTTLVATQPGLSYSDTGLGDGVTRWYRVYAINGKGTGGSYLALSGTTAIPVAPTPGGGSSSPAADSGSGSSESAVAKVPVVAAPVRPQAATALIRQTARIKAPSSRRFAVGTDVVLAKKAVKTNAGVTVRWSRVKASKGICSVATVRGRAVATMLKPGTCTVVGKAAAPSSAYSVFQTTRTYRVR
ncbi:MAG: fibronectin type III domain-containing protein, partial [Actinobacteria bacterium]|nr:fibronectin type III domain-containing protein [Actinomycetota bacterium]